MTQRLVDQVDDHFGRNHGVYGSALSDMALMMKAMGNHQEATEVYLKALEVSARCQGWQADPAACHCRTLRRQYARVYDSHTPARTARSVFLAECPSF